MYARRIEEHELTFDFGAGLARDNLLIVDRETDSVWSQLAAGAIAGPLEGEPLRVVPSIQSTWGQWRRMHPGTRVLVAPGEEGRPYHYRSRPPGAPPPAEPATRHDTSVLGLGLALGGEAVFFPFEELEQLDGELQAVVGDRPVTVHYRAEGLTAWGEGEDGDLLPGVLAYESGWRSFHPETRVFRAR